MAQARPELVFLSGPQAGQRAVLMENRQFAGRSPQADIVLTEEFISRQHLQFTFLPEGWAVENVSSSSPIEVNGRKYRAGKQVLLETGDVIALGHATELLFVQAGEDPDAVLAAWRAEHPDATPGPSDLVHAEPDRPTQTPPEPDPAPALQASPPAEQPTDELSEDQRDAAQRRRRMLLLGGLMGLSVLSFLVLIFLGSLRDDDSDDGSQGPPPDLSGEDIRTAITAPLNRAPNEVSAEKALREARRDFQIRSAGPANLYQCVKNYRLYLAFRRPERRTFQPGDERQFETAREELIADIQDRYDAAIIFLNRRQWVRAYDEFQTLLNRLPIEATNDDPPIRDTIIENVRAHLRFVSRKLTKKND